MSSGIDNLASQLQKTINEKDKKKKTGYYAQSEVLKVTDDTVWVKIPGGIDETPVARTIDAKPGDKVQVRVEGGRAWIAGNYTDPATGDSRVINLEKTVTKEFTVVKELVADKATIGQLRAAEAEIDDLTATKADISDLSAATARIGALEADHVSTNDLQAANAEITSLKTTKADISDLNAATARIGDLEADHVSVSDLNAATGRIGDLEADHVTVNDFTAATGRIGALEADHVTVNDFTAATGRIGTLETDNTNIKGRLTAAEADIDNVEADTAKIHNLTANQISATVGYIEDLTGENITAQNIIADHATVGSLDSNYAHITNGTIDNAKIGYADVNDLNTHYAGIDLANVNNAWIENGVVKDAAISDAKIIGVSANKLTAGTIDASNITVTNLNADNITTGTINGQRIGTGSLSLDKLSEDVYTEAEVNTIVDGLNDRIDGAIETFTGTVVPTLNNAPANAWTTTKLKDQHIGDVYYVVNTSSDKNGYCYRFTKSGSTYSWQLIKDSDVTAALSRLQTAEGKIGNIETFDEEISAFKTTAEGQISSLQTKTTNLETSLGDKVSTATFNELSQTVDGNTASITTLTNTVSTKADSSTVTTLSNTVNEVSQTATANSSKISSLTTTLGTNADGTTKTGDIVHRTSAVEQDLSGFKTTVSETYTTKQYTDGKITQEVTDRNAAITAKATEITTSVSETYATKDTVNGIDGRVSAAETAITQKADSVTVSAIATDLANNYTKTADFSVAPGQISSAISTAQTNATNAANSATDTKLANYSTTTQMNSAIQQQANSIALSVAQTEIGKVKIGGQNLIENSEHFVPGEEPYTNATATVYGTTVLDGEKCYYASGSKYVQVDFPTLTVGEQYIFSCDVARQSGGSTVHAYITIGTNTPIDVGTVTGGKWKRFEVPFTASEETTFAKVHVYSTSGAASYVGHFRRFKLEHGNIATDWSPAPADLESYADSAVATAKAEIKVTTDGISTEVSGKADANNVYTKSEINQTVSGLNTTIESKANSSDVYTKSQIDQTVNGINTSVSAKADGAETTASLALKANKDTLTSEINASADTVKINADRVNIAGAAIFENYATKTYLSDNYTNTTDLNAALDDKADSDDIPTKVSDLTNDSGFQTESDVETAIENAKGKWYAVCDTAAATTEKVATITPATTAFVLEEGVEVYVKFSITNSGAVKSIKLNVNGTGAYNIKVIYNGTIDNINAASYLKANYVYRFYWDGTYWIADLPYNSTYNLGTNKYYNTILAKSAITKERIIVGDESGYAMAASGTTFNIAYPILWTTASIAVNKTNYADLYTSTYDRTLAEAAYPSFVGSPRKVVYLVGTLNGNTVTISSEIITCTEPTSADGKIYIPIGRLGNQTTGWNYFNFAPSTDPTIYAYINGAFQPVSWSVKSAVLEEQYIYKSAVSGTSSMSGTDTWVTEDDDVQNTWTIKRPTYDSDYPVLFVAKQSKYVGGALYCTTPLKDDTTTVIDGGHITTGTIDASQVTVTNINADNITSGQLSSNYIATSSIIISDLTNDSGYYTSADVDERIEDQTYDLVETVTEHGEKIQSNSDRLDALELANSDQDTTIASLNLAIVDVSERIDPYENSIIVTDTSVTVQSGDGSVRVEDNRVAFKGGGNTVAWTDTEALNSKKMVATELHMGSLEVNDDESVSYVGSIAIIARQNGHVSIKKVQ